jgi:YVTN family beta-propeller protein
MTGVFWRAVSVFAVCLAVALPAAAEPGKYLGPLELVASPDGASLFVLNVDAAQVAVLDVASGKVARTIGLPPGPTGLALSPDGATLYVTCATPQGTVSEIDVASGNAKGRIPVGHGACGPTVSPDGKRLYVCNRFDDKVALVDLEAKKVAVVPAVREPIHSAVTPDGATLLVSNHLPLDPSDGYDVACHVTVINTADKSTSTIRLLNGSSSLRGVCVAPDGKYAYAAHILSRYQMPTTQLERGWMNTNALSIIDVAANKLVNTVLLDDIDLGAAMPWDVAVTPDGKSICVSCAGTHEVIVIDVAALHKKLAEVPKTEEEARKAGRYDDRTLYSSVTVDDVPNDLAFLVGLKKRIMLPPHGPWGWLDADKEAAASPRGLAIVGSKAYITCYFSDVLAAVELEPEPSRKVELIPLGPRPELTQVRRGELHFFDAWLCFQHWQSCASCHPDVRVDGLNWDLMNDGMGNPKNAKSMLLSHQTPPSMASGVRADAETAVRSGFTHILFAVRPEEECVAIDEYLKALKPVPSPHLTPDGQLSDAAKRGKELFFSERVGCGKCHPEPLYTDLQMHDVASRGQYDRRDDFDTSTLIECWRTAPYMHDGHYTSMKELFTVGKHGQKGGGDVEGLSEQEVNDLVEFVLSL